MKITVYGSGYVGLVIAACFAEVGHEVICMDVDESKIEKLTQGIIPIYEPGLKEVVMATLHSHHLHFTTELKMAVQHGECQFIAVGTPPNPQGNADLSYVMAVASGIATYMSAYTVIVNKSTVPIGTGARVKEIIHQGLQSRGQSFEFDVVSNPEFLKEGAALEDCRNPSRVVLGVESQQGEKILRKVYSAFDYQADRLIVMDIPSAELTKYAANAMLATKISFMNEMAHLAEKVGADIEMVRQGIGSDPRIGPHFIHAGCGYGGSCFGKDMQALIQSSRMHQSPIAIIEAVEKMNTAQKRVLFEKIMSHYQGFLRGKTFAVWGLAFKPETDDMRDAPSLSMLKALWEAKAKVQVYDPKAMNEAEKIFGNGPHIAYCANKEEALEGADALVILTQWEVFKAPDFTQIKSKLLEPIIFDGRNIYDPRQLAQMGFIYYGIGRGMKTKCLRDK